MNEIKILFLDDAEYRIEAFSKKVPTAKIVETAKDVIDILSSGVELEYLFLDHDLGGEQYVDSDREDCGMEVVRWMMENKVDVGTVIVHSHNIVAAEKMRLGLEESGYNVQSIQFRDLINRINI